MSRLRILAVVLALGTAACGSDTPTTPTTPTTPVTVTDTFAGTLTPNGAATYTFTTGLSGQVTATLTTLSPNSTLIVGLSLGTWNGNACQIILSKDSATQLSFVVGQASQANTFCVRIYDVGNLVDPATYEIQVNHP
jgi:ABC-type Fe3+-hydroxamate transport system substrate-binding protein